jgi:type I restriction enzyme S subunit
MSAEGWMMITLNEAGVSLIDCEHKTPITREVGYPYVAIPQI